MKRGQIIEIITKDINSETFQCFFSLNKAQKTFIDYLLTECNQAPDKDIGLDEFHSDILFAIAEKIIPFYAWFKQTNQANCNAKNLVMGHFYSLTKAVISDIGDDIFASLEKPETIQFSDDFKNTILKKRKRILELKTAIITAFETRKKEYIAPTIKQIENNLALARKNTTHATDPNMAVFIAAYIGVENYKSNTMKTSKEKIKQQILALNNIQKGFEKTVGAEEQLHSFGEELQKFEQLKFSSQEISSCSYEEFSKNFSTLNKLHLDWPSINLSDIIEIMTALQKNTTIKSVHLNCAYISSNDNITTLKAVLEKLTEANYTLNEILFANWELDIFCQDILLRNVIFGIAYRDNIQAILNKIEHGNSVSMSELKLFNHTILAGIQSLAQKDLPKEQTSFLIKIIFQAMELSYDKCGNRYGANTMLSALDQHRLPYNAISYGSLSGKLLERIHIVLSFPYNQIDEIQAKQKVAAIRQENEIYLIDDTHSSKASLYFEDSVHPKGATSILNGLKSRAYLNIVEPADINHLILIVNALKNNKFIIGLKLQSGFISSPLTSYILPLFLENTTLKTLDLSQVKCDGVELGSIIKNLEYSFNITEIYLKNKSDQDFFAPLLNRNKKLDLVWEKLIQEAGIDQDELEQHNQIAIDILVKLIPVLNTKEAAHFTIAKNRIKILYDKIQETNQIYGNITGLINFFVEYYSSVIQKDLAICEDFINQLYLSNTAIAWHFRTVFTHDYFSASN